MTEALSDNQSSAAPQNAPSTPGFDVGILVGLAATAVAMVIYFLVDALLTTPIPPFNLFDYMARVLPGPLITAGIDTMVTMLTLVGLDVADTAKTAEQIFAVILMSGVMTVGAMVYFIVMNAIRGSLEVPFLPILGGLVLGLLIAIPSAVAGHSVVMYSIPEAIYIVSVLLFWGVAVAVIYDRLTSPAPAGVEPSPEGLTAEQVDRRSFLIRMGAASAAITVVGGGVSVALVQNRGQQQAASATEDELMGSTLLGEPVVLPNTDAEVQPVAGTRPEYTPLEDHYQIDINTRPPQVNEEDWRLTIDGLVRNPLSLTLTEIVQNYPAQEEFVTLSCISNRIGGSLISTTLWTGASLQAILEEAGLRNGARYLHIESADGFYETVDLNLVMEDPRIMLAYAWDHQLLRTRHGFPLRIWIPDRYGMKQPKWIESITVSDEYREGYWVERGWSEDAIMKITSVIDTVLQPEELNGEMVVPVGGIAHGGAQSIGRVQVRVNGGEWQDATLRRPLSDVTWVIWRYEWPFEAGLHTFEVRAFDGEGNPQIEERADPRPDGATGIHSLRETVGS